MAYYSSKVLEFHATLATPRGNPHPWESKPWTWPMGLRPMLYYYESGGSAPGCGSDDCVGAVMAIGTPALWWTAFPVLGWSLWRWITRRDWRYAAVLVGYGAGILPWFTDIDRQMYFFYMTPVVPFLVLAVTLVLGKLMGSARSPTGRRTFGVIVAGSFVVLVMLNFAYFYPILSYDLVTRDGWLDRMWFARWI